ncbi:Hypothetical_protein [Hexamita inflata]|uniref:Hypothetical_protein n=1 Tax=Hexamita inflata TaxID=28002 RepID=A0AA86NAU8_9EUKA|nr:Hypothetical protein HINF_LOCUS3972 [Hexamita inflata]CAI9949970.1 Hypothetical protein HINF_LOCUS37615 [Hexamita inflata]
MQTIENILYDKIEYKLTGSLQSNRGLVKQFITKSSDNFDVSLRMVKFSCAQMRGAQQTVCNQMLYDDIHSENAIPTYNFDVMFYFQNKLIYLLKASNCLSRYTCWRYGVAILKDTGLTLEMERNNICDKWDQYYDYSNVTSRLTVQNSKYQTIQYIEKYFQIGHSINQNNFSWTCTEINCSLFKRNLTYSFEYDFVPFTAKFIFSEDSDQRKLFTTSKYYKIGKYCGLVLLAIVLIVVALKFVKANQVIRQYRGYAKIKKPTQDQILLKQLVQSIQNKLIEANKSKISNMSKIQNQTYDLISRLKNQTKTQYSYAIE